jgi:hypothetical protein
LSLGCLAGRRAHADKHLFLGQADHLNASVLSNLCSLDCAATQCDGNGNKCQNAHITDFSRAGYIQTHLAVAGERSRSKTVMDFSAQSE